MRLSEFTNKLKALMSNDLSLVNAVSDDIASINNSLYILLENGCFTQNQKKLKKMKAHKKPLRQTHQTKKMRRKLSKINVLMVF